MYIKVLYFGKLRELLEIDSTLIEFNKKTTINDVLDFILEKYPILNENKFVIALNKEYIFDYNTEINIDDQIALIPPISGG